MSSHFRRGTTTPLSKAGRKSRLSYKVIPSTRSDSIRNDIIKGLLLVENPMHYYLDVLKKYAVFEGRASRKEYWMFVLFNILISIVLSIVFDLLGVHLLVFLYSLAILIPSIAVGVRRLHDTNRTGWWLLIGLIPLIGTIVLLVFFVIDSQPGSNQYGPNPKGV
jgi:uncharacterized membrane protein YhaH (DUF805 family)